MQKVKLTIAYDGTDFHGFQRQTGKEKAVRTVQGALESTLQKIRGVTTTITGAGRTDAGVHAQGQVVTFADDGKIPVERWPWLLNHRLPRDIVIREAQVVAPSFHPRYDAVSKAYRYTIDTAAIPDIFSRRFCTRITTPLDVELMQQAAQQLIGTHDFTSLSKASAQVFNRVRTVETVTVTSVGTYIHVRFVGNGFLQHMVRIMTGLIVDVGLGKARVGSVPQILAAKDRRAAGRTMPPEGLILQEVKYE